MKLSFGQYFAALAIMGLITFALAPLVESKFTGEQDKALAFAGLNFTAYLIGHMVVLAVAGTFRKRSSRPNL